MNTATLHYYRQFRAHQHAVAMDGSGSLTVYPSGRTETSYGSAPYGEHALSAYLSAKCHIAFRQRLAADVADHKKRSRAAKQAWKTRRAGAR